jgi:hypothetical protein
LIPLCLLVAEKIDKLYCVFYIYFLYIDILSYLDHYNNEKAIAHHLLY